MLWYVVNVVGVPAWFAVESGDARLDVASGHVGREVEVQELVVKGPTIWDSGGRCSAYGEDLERVDPIEGYLGLENYGVGALPGALTNGGSGVVDPAEGVHKGSVAAVETRYVDGV